MEKLKNLLKRVKATKRGKNKLFEIVFKDKSVQSEIIRLNTDVQLFENGLNARGVSLESIGGEYAPLTVMLKREQGLPFTRITLYDTGEFYASFKVTAKRTAFIIKADTIKQGIDNKGRPTRTDLVDRWGDDILGLNNDSIKEISSLIIEELKKAYLRQIV